MRGLVLALALAACATPEPASRPGPLADTHWTRSDDADAAPHFPTLEFDANGRASGFDGCNLWFAETDQRHGRLVFKPSGSTRRACSAQSAAAAAQRFWAAIRATRSARIEDGALILIDERGREVARFARD